MKGKKMLDIKVLKARLLCEGARVTKETIEYILHKQNPYSVRRGGLSSGVKVRLVPSKVLVNFPVYHSLPAAISIELDNQNNLVFIENGQVIGNGVPLDPPVWYGQKLSDGTPIERILTQHGGQLAGVVYEDCALFNFGNHCQFCVMRFSTSELSMRLKSGERFVEAISLVPDSLRTSLVLNSGMTTHRGRGIELIAPVVGEIRRVFSNIPIAVEITPPEDLDWLGRLKSAGCDSLMMNLECWDKEARRKYIPGKDDYCPRELYLAAFKEAVQVFGQGHVSSCFVCGIENMETLKEGIVNTIGLGAIPSPLSGRCFEDISGYNFAAHMDWRDFMEVLVFTKVEMFKAGLYSTDRAGCVACGMCDMVHDNK